MTLQPHDVFKPYTPSTGFQNRFQNPAADPTSGFPQ
jgi:hypothetical protein